MTWIYDPGYGCMPDRAFAAPGCEPRLLHVHLKTHVEPQESLVAALKSIAVEYRQIDWMALPRGRVGDELVRQVAEFKPTLVFMQLQTAGVIMPDHLARARELSPYTTFVTWCGDIGRDNGPTYGPSTWYIHALGVDLALYSSWTQVVSHRTQGLKQAAYLQIGYDEDVYYPAAPHEYGSKYDVVFLGQDYDARAWPTVPDNDIALRRVIVGALHSAHGKRFGLFGQSWSDYGAEYVTSLKTREIYVASKAAVSLSLVSNYDKYSSDRLLRSLACGTPTFVKRFYDYASWGLVDEVNCILWNTPDELLAKLDVFLEMPHEDQRRIGIAGAKLVKGNHTWGVRMLEMLPLVHATRVGQDAV